MTDDTDATAVGRAAIRAVGHAALPAHHAADETPQHRADDETPQHRADDETPQHRADDETPQHRATDETPQHRADDEPLDPAAQVDRSAQSAPVQPTPANFRGRGSLRLPAFWMLVGLLAFGTWRTVSTMAVAFRVFPVATLTATGLFLVYAVPFVIVARSIDFLEREPPLLLTAAAAWGGLVAVSIAIPANAAVHDLLAKFVSPAYAASWGPAIAGPTVEELLKTLGVVMIVLIASRQVNSVADGAVYGAFVGLGFQVVENIIYAVNAVGVAGRGDHVGPVIVTFFLRGFLGGLWSHTLFSALAGAGVAYFVVRRNRSLGRRLSVVALAVLGAWTFHFVWNSPLLSDGFGYGSLGVLFALLVKGIPALLMVVLLIRSVSGREADFYLDKLAALDDPSVATPAELAALRSGRRRMAARRYAYARAGRKGSSAVGLLQRAQARLAVDLSRGGARSAELTDAVLVQRGRLDSLGHGEALAPPGRVRTWPTIVAGLVLGIMVALAVTAAIKALGGH